jgi:hypothetical protein
VTRLTGADLLVEVNWLLDFGVHPLMICQVVGKRCAAIEVTGRRYSDARVVSAFNRYSVKDK